ncbi:ORC1-type DNA replication protein [Methanofollis ethanolicus]|uniref:ORC1-type DNA replication protein n=1 Tax=Methanofollis ethanolicus TaxID=488124 RepID=UPI00082EBB5A|nr:ORC1-type DNA replication protein [Methanofollis ethanolicus]
MTPSLLMSDQTLFRDPDLFEFDRLPEQFNYRDTQVKDLAFALRPALRGTRPLNTVLRGPPGTGKTTAVRRIFAEVEETTQMVVPVLVSCQKDRTRPAVFARIYEGIAGHKPPAVGVPYTKIVDEVGHLLATREAVLVVCLDDADALLPDGVLNEVLAAILRLHESYPGARTGVWMTVSCPAFDLLRDLDRPTFSVLCPNEVAFPPYTADEVRGIIGERVLVGLYPGVLPPAAMDLLVERTMACGDLRIGLDMVKRAVLAAEKEARTEVTVEDVLTAYSLSRHLHVAIAVRSLAAGERAVLDAVLALEREGGGPVTAGMAYERVCAGGRTSYTTFHERLKKLEHLRLVDLAVRQGKGRTRVIEVRDGVGEVIAPSGSAEVSVVSPAGVADDGKCRYDGGR